MPGFGLRSSALAIVVLALAPAQAWSAAYVWTPLAGGTYNWDSPANWNPSSSYPDGEADIATFSNNISGNQTINLNRVISLGVLNLGSANNFRSFTVVANTGYLLFNNGNSAPSAQLNVTGPVTHTVAGPVTLFSILTIQTTNGFLNLTGDVSGQGAIIREGSGSVTLSGTNTYAGGTFLNSGSLIVAADANLGQSGTALTFGGTGGGLQITSDFTSNREIVINSKADIFPQGHTATLSGAIRGSGILRLDNSGGGSVVLTGANSYTGGTAIDRFVKVSISADSNLGGAGTLLSMASGAILQTTATFTTNRHITLTGSDSGSAVLMIDPGTTLTENGTIDDGSGGTGARLDIQGGGALVLGGTNTYRGGTLINDTTVIVSSDSNLGAPAGALNLNGGKLQATASFVTNRNITLTYPPTLEVASGATLTISGAISGSNANGSFAKRGEGTLILGATNSYTTPTSIQEGTLLVNGSIPSSVTVLAGTLGGSGTTGAISLNGGTLSPGSGAGILSAAGNVALTLGSTLLLDLNGAVVGTGYDQLAVTGVVGLGNATLSLNLGFIPAPGQSFRIVDNDASEPVAGTFSGLAEGAQFTAAGQTFAISYKGGTGNDVVLTAVPEPETLALAPLSALILALRRRGGVR